MLDESNVEQAEIEDEFNEEEQSSSNWLLVAGFAVVVIGLLVRWLSRRR